MANMINSEFMDIYMPTFEIYRRLQCVHCSGQGSKMVLNLKYRNGGHSTVPCDDCAGSGTSPIPAFELGMII